MNLFRTWLFKYLLEHHWIDICGNSMWLDMHPERKWPEWRQPCSHGTPTIEDYPVKTKGGAA